MPSMNFHTRLEEVARWYDWNRPSITDVKKLIEFQETAIANFFDLMALASVKFRELEGRMPKMERPYWQSNNMPTFVEHKSVNPEDPELGIRG